MNNVLTILLSSGVIASVITSIFNLISIRNTNKRLLQVEQIKNDYSIKTFRYTKLFELNAELYNLPDIDDTFLENKDGKLVHSKEKFAKVVRERRSQNSNFVKIFFKAKPLFDKKIISNVNDLIQKEQIENDKIYKELCIGKDSNMNLLIDIRSKLENEFKASIIEQLEALIKI